MRGHFLFMTHCLNAALCHSSFVLYLQRLPQRSLIFDSQVAMTHMHSHSLFSI